MTSKLSKFFRVSNKVLLILSFIPYLIIVGYGIYCAFFGFSFFSGGPYEYGLEGFFSGAFIMALCLCIFFVIPACAAVQITNLVLLIMKKCNAPVIAKVIVGVLTAAVLFGLGFMLARDLL